MRMKVVDPIINSNESVLGNTFFNQSDFLGGLNQLSYKIWIKYFTHGHNTVTLVLGF